MKGGGRKRGVGGITFERAANLLATQPGPFAFFDTFVFSPLLFLEQRRHGPDQLFLGGFWLRHVLVGVQLPQLDAQPHALLQHPPSHALMAGLATDQLNPSQAVPQHQIQHLNRFMVVVRLLQQVCNLDLDSEDLVAERVHPNLLRHRQRLPVVFDGILRLQIDVRIIEGAAQFGGDGLREGLEFTNDIVPVKVVGINQ